MSGGRRQTPFPGLFAAVEAKDGNGDHAKQGRLLHDCLMQWERIADASPVTDALRRDLAAFGGRLAKRVEEAVSIPVRSPDASDPVVLKIGPGLDAFPLELYRNMGLKRPLARHFDDLDFPAASGAPAGGKRGGIVIAATRSPSPALAWLDDEVGYLGKTLGAHAEVAEWRVEPEHGRRADAVDSFLRAVDGADILHLCGHLEIHEGKACFQLDGERGYWLDPAEMHLICGAPPGLVVTNTCGSGDNMGFAHACIEGGARAFVQPAVPLTDRDAAELAASLYRHLHNGLNIGEAVLEVRRQTRWRPSLLWAALRLYGTPFWSPGSC